MQDVWTRSPAVVIAFPDAAERPQRSLAVNEPRGEILLFTGVPALRFPWAKQPPPLLISVCR